MTIIDDINFVCSQLQRLNELGEGNWTMEEFYYFDHLMETLVVLQREMLGAFVESGSVIIDEEFV